jgi:hypothetical protein
MTPEIAFAELVAGGFLVSNAAGWYHVARAPTVFNLHWFLKRIHVLVSWSIALGGGPARVELSTGDRPDEILYRLITR